MTPRLLQVGDAPSRVVVVDDVLADVTPVIDIAASLAPFPSAAGYYPGVRRLITPDDRAATGYVETLLSMIAPFVGGAFDADAFDLIEASFSIVTARPAALSAAQRTPHFDSDDPDYLAILHYLAEVPGSGTAFYRQRATAIERVDAHNRDAFIAAAKRAGDALSGYTNASNHAFERIGAVDAKRDRVLIYQGSLLHSGIIPAAMPLSADPRAGRLTANLFVQVRR